MKKYSLLGNLRYCCHLLKAYAGAGSFGVMAVQVITGLVTPFLAMALPSVIVYLLTHKLEPATIMLSAVGYLFLLQIFAVSSQYAADGTKKRLFLFRLEVGNEIYHHLLDMEFEKMESVEGQKKMGLATKAIHYGNEVGVEAFLTQGPKILLNVLGLLVYAAVAGGINLWILVYLFVSAVIVVLLNWRASRYDFACNEEGKNLWRKFDYLSESTINTKNAKDIRLYHAKQWFGKAFEQLDIERWKLAAKIKKRYMTASISEILLSFVRDGVVYVYLISRMAKGELALDQFLLYLGVVAGFSTWMNGIFKAVQELVQNNVVMSEWRDFMDYGLTPGEQEELKWGSYREYERNCEEKEGAKETPWEKKPKEIRLEHVSFAYPGSEREILSDISMTLHAGEKLALVGINGAGKTTLIKLMSGLYRPTGGKIYMNGTDISTMETRDYFNNFSVVFQDVFAFAFPVESNVSCRAENHQNTERLNECLKMADLADFVEKLPEGIHTMMLKDLDPRGVELSGGQMQKLMLARALYRNAPIVILDEPTAALDPLAESNMYEHYHQFTKDKTSVFISHRLSSTRFCDRILFLKEGKIAEEGTHESLMKKNGEYANMFGVQSHYYKDTLEEEGMLDENINLS